MTETLAAYSHALMSVALFAVLCQVLSALLAPRLSKAGHAPGTVPPVNYDDPVFRLFRSYHNSVDSMGPFAAAVVAAVLAGASPFWVNLLASLGLLARLGVVVCYVPGIGKNEFGPRTFAYIFQSAMTILLGLLAAGALLF
ncbi:MAPEG family protein [Roseivivax sp.]